MWFQKYVYWFVKIEKEVKKFIMNVLKDELFFVIYFCNGIDFVSIYFCLMKYMYLYSVV